MMMIIFNNMKNFVFNKNNILIKKIKKCFTIYNNLINKMIFNFMKYNLYN